MTTAQRIKDIEDEMSKTQKNKNTEYHLGQLKGSSQDQAPLEPASFDDFELY
jgi:ribosome-interacting GTPase 1